MNWTAFTIPLVGALAGFLVAWGGMRVVQSILQEEIKQLREAANAATACAARLEERTRFLERDIERLWAAIRSAA